MSDYRLRINQEKEQLEDKIKKIENLFGSESIKKLSPLQQSLLKTQYHIMKSYSAVLFERLINL